MEPKYCICGERATLVDYIADPANDDFIKVWFCAECWDN